jgi:hypothetical protein
MAVMTDWSKRVDAGIITWDSFCECDVIDEYAAKGVFALSRNASIFLMQEKYP